MKKRYLLLPMLLLSMVVFAAERKSIYDLFYSGDGTVLKPSYSFNSDKDTGLYTSGANTLNLSTNGTLGLTLNSDQSVDIGNLKLLTNTLSSTDTNGDLNLDANGTGSIVAVDDLSITDGSTSIPGLNFTSDENTGIYRSTTDTLGLISGGYEGLQVKKSTGNYSNIGIGGNASTSESFPLLIERSHSAGINVQASNPNGGSGASTKILLKGDTGSISSGELTLWPSAQTNHGYVNRLVLRSSGTASGVSIVGSGSGDDEVRIYNGGVASTNESIRFNADYSMQLMQEITTPATPATNTIKLYSKSGSIYKLDDAGVETELGEGGGGSSGINYIINPDAETDVTSTSSIGVNTTITRNTTLPLISTGDFNISITSSAPLGEGFKFLMNDIDVAIIGKTAVIKFWYKTDSSYDNKNLQMMLYSTDSSVEYNIVNDDDGLLVETNGDKKLFVGSVALDSVDNTYELRGILQASPSATFVLNMDEVKVGPDEFGPGFIGTEWESITPTGSWITNTTYTGMKKRVGDSYKYQVLVSLAGAPNTASLTINIPDGNIDAAKLLSATADNSILGTFRTLDSGTNLHAGFVAYNGTSSVQLRYFTSNTTNPTINTSILNQAQPFTYASGDSVIIDFEVPIENLSAGNLISTQEANYLAASTSTTDIQPTGTIAASYNVIKFGTVDSDKHNLYNTTTGQWIAPRDGVVDVSAFIEYGFTTGTNVTNITKVANTTTSKNIFGYAFTPSSVNRGRTNVAGSLKVSKGDVLEVQSWSDGTSPTFPTSINSFTIKYQEKFKSFGVYKNDEYILVHGTLSSAPSVSSVYSNVTSQVVEPGTYEASGFIEYLNTGAAGATYYGYAFISENSGSSTADLDYSLNARREFYQLTNNFLGSTNVPRYEIIINEQTTLYLKGAISHSSATNVTVEKYKLDLRRIN